MADTVHKPFFKLALLEAEKSPTGTWASIGALVNEHVIDYDFMTYRNAVASKAHENELLATMLVQIRMCAIVLGIHVEHITTDLNWSDSTYRKRVVPGVNLCGVKSLGLLAKEYESADLLAVNDI